MELTLKNIEEITTGAVRVQEENGAIRLYRFTKEQEKLYQETNEGFYAKTFSTAGIKLSFKTNSTELYLKIFASPATTRTYFSVDVFSDDSLVGCIDNFSDKTLPQNYTQEELPLGRFSKTFSLGEGEKNICIHLPWSVCVAIEKISLDDGAFVEAVKPSKKLLAFGDSITHGYDALRPSNRYMAKLSKSLGAEEINKAIGGEVFFPPLANLPDNILPDYITVAYGTNDWSTTDEEIFLPRCKAFFENLSKNYPQSKIFAITPIWRKDMDEKTRFGDFRKVEQHIRTITENIENVTVISGFDFVPKEEKYFADLRLHPNDEGFDHYEKHLRDALLACLKL